MTQSQLMRDSHRPSSRRRKTIRVGCAVLMSYIAGSGSPPANSAEAPSDIRAYNHQGIQKLIALDVLRASRVANGEAQLVVGSVLRTACCAFG